jgi:hypothetical protein
MWILGGSTSRNFAVSSEELMNLKQAISYEGYISRENKSDDKVHLKKVPYIHLSEMTGQACPKCSGER